MRQYNFPKSKNPKPLKDMTGMRFDRLTAVRHAGQLNGQARWACKCDCGGEVYRLGSHLRRPGASHMCDACRTQRRAG